MDLWQHQQDSVDFILPLKAGGLFHEMGVGKTLCALELLRRWEMNFALVVAPKAVLQVWEREAKKHFNGHFNVTVLNGASVAVKAKQAKQAIQHQGSSIVVVNYESAWREPLASLLFKSPPDVIILDEAHKIKAPWGKASIFMKKIGPLVKRRLALTGTPLPHSPLDCYALYRFLDPGIFGRSFTNFKARYAIYGGYGGYEIKSWINTEELHEKMYSIAYRVRSEDVLDLPETMDETLTFELSPKAKKIYADLEKHLIAEIETGEITAANAMVKLLRLQQLTGGWLRADESVMLEHVDTGKAELLKELLEGMGEEQVVVFCRFHQDLESIAAACQDLGLTYAELSGRRNELQAWEEYKAQVLMAQVQAGSLGIDLTQARYAVYYSTGFSLGEYLQSRARINRPGQKRPCVYYHLVAEKTVDAKIMMALAKRADLVSYIVDELRSKK